MVGFRSTGAEAAPQAGTFLCCTSRLRMMASARNAAFRPTTMRPLTAVRLPMIRQSCPKVMSPYPKVVKVTIEKYKDVSRVSNAPSLKYTAAHNQALTLKPATSQSTSPNSTLIFFKLNINDLSEARKNLIP